MASGYTNSHPRDEGDFYFETRFDWSSSYDPSTNTSTVTFTPKIYTTVNMGNDLRMFNSKDNNGGVYRDGSLIYAFPTNYSSGNFLRTWSNPYEDWVGLFTAGSDFPTLTVTHNNSGAASIKLGLRGGVISMNSYQSAYSSWLDDGYYINLSESRSLIINYNPNGGSGAPSNTYFYGSTENIVLSSTIPTRAGYTFLGWSTSGAATTATYSAGQNIGTRTSSLALFAVWRVNSYTVSCQDRVGSASGTLLGTKTASYTYGSSVSGASFGSNTSYDAYYTGYHYTGSSSTITVDGNETVYRYFAPNTWTVSYNANGGSGAPSSQTKTYGVNLTLSSTRPTRANSSAGSYTVTYNANGGTVSPSSASAARTTSYTFSSWNTAANGSGTSYSSGGTYSANSAATLYAQWSSTTTTASVTLPTPTRTGYTFKGWATSSSASTGVTGNYTPTKDITLYATWELKSYTLSISRGNGTTITVKRNGTSLSNGATIYHFDVLSISISANTGYTIKTHTVNNTTWDSGNYTVEGNVSVVSTATLISYTLSLSYSSNGVSISVNRTSSPIGSGSIGALKNGDKLYYNDVIEINYTISGAYQLLTATVNNIDISTASLPYNLTVKSNVVISVTAKLGAIVYIGNEAYQAFIGTLVNGNAVWQQYQAFIGNGSTYDQY